MARKRLNKKVAIIGSAVFILLALVAVFVILRFTGKPTKFIEDGDAAWAVKDYKTAQRSYLKAFNLSRTAQLKVDILFKLADVYMRTDEWRKVIGCWEQIVTTDTTNIKARLGRLQYRYEIADSLTSLEQNVSGHWKEIRSHASELTGIIEKAGLLDEPVAKWEPYSGLEQAEPDRGVHLRIGTYLYMVKGRSEFELAKMGAVTAPEELLNEAAADLEKASKLDPNNIDAYQYLAGVSVARGELLASRGKLEERDASSKQTLVILEQAVKVAGNNPTAHINLLYKKLELAQRGDLPKIKQQMQLLEPDYLGLVRKFPASDDAFAALSRFYLYYSQSSGPQLSGKYFDEAIAAAEKSIELSKTTVSHSVFAADLYYRKFSIYKSEPAIRKAVEITENALQLPAAKDTSGPRHYHNLVNRLALYSSLANYYIEQILEYSKTGEDSQKKIWLERAELAEHEIEQIQGSGENPMVIKWQGMLELAKGNTNLAVCKLYAAYEQSKAGSQEQSDSLVAYTLARIFKDSVEAGAVVEFLVAAANSGMAGLKPEVLLDLGQAGMKIGWLDRTLEVIDYFEQSFGPNPRSKDLRIKALIAKGHITEAEEAISKLDSEAPETIILNIELVRAKARQLQDAIQRSQPDEDATIVVKSARESPASPESIKAMMNELANNRRLEAGLMQKLLVKEPNAVEESQVASVCEKLITQRQIKDAQNLVAKFLEQFPNNSVGFFYKQLLSEPNPADVTQERRRQIREEAIAQIPDPVRRALEAGLVYERINENEKAIEQFKKVLESASSQPTVSEPAYVYTIKVSPQRTAASHLFDIARETKNWDLVDNIVKTVQQYNLDDFQGQLFAARVAYAKGDYNTALSKLDECIKQKPVFSQAYVLRGNVQTALGNEHSAIEDIRRGFSFNPTDSIASKALANALYARNRKLGQSVSSEQRAEVQRALETAIRLNPFDLLLLTAYAEYISTDEPLKAMALRQTLQKRSPTLRNAVDLGKLATRIAVKEMDQKRKEAFFAVALSALEQAKQMDPKDQIMLDSYAEYYRATGQYNKAQALLTESKDDKLLWRHYLRIGRIDEAKKVLEQLYKQNSKESDVLKGLVVVSEQYNDQAAVLKYSEELLTVEDNAENRIGQLRAFIGIGLIKEAQLKLQSLKEKYPNESRTLLFEATLAMRQGQLKMALELANRNLQVNQGDASAWQLRGEINTLMGSYDQAIDDFKRSKSLSDSTEARIALAQAYIWAGRNDEAISELKSIIEKPDASDEARMMLEGIYLRLGRKETLKQFYDKTLEKIPNNVHWYNRTAAFAVASAEFDRAEQLYRKAYDLKRNEYATQSPTDAVRDVEYITALDGYLRCLVLAAGEPNNAQKSGWHPEKLDRVFEEGGKYVDTAFAPIAFYRMAEAKFRVGDRQSVVDYCRKAVDKAWSNDVIAVEILMRTLLLVGPDEVSKYCEERLKATPDSMAANFTMYNLTKIRGEYDASVGYIDKCIAIAGPDTQQGIEHIMQRTQLLTVAYEKTSDNRYLKTAIRDYESLLDKMPNNTTALNNLAYLLAQSSQKLSKAIEYAKRAVELKPNDANFLDTYGYVLLKSGKNSEAAESLAAAIQQYGRGSNAPPEVYEHLGMAKEALGEKSQALAAYKRVLEVGADNLSAAAKQRINAAIDRLTQ